MADRIIALVDRSVYAASVCEHAGWVAKRCALPVELLHVMGRRGTPLANDLSGTIRLGARSALLDELATLDEQHARLANAQGRALLEDARALTQNAGADADEVTTRLETGDLLERVTDKRAAPALIVIGKRGEAADFAQDHPGSNLERIVRSAKVPVLVAARAFRPISRIMLAFDAGASALKAVDYLASSPAFEDTRIDVVMVSSNHNTAQPHLDEAILRLRAAGRKAKAVTLDGSADSALITHLEEQDHDLLVMGAYGHSRIRRMIIGSVTTQMLMQSRRSVLLFR